MTTQQIAHQWAHQLKSCGKSSNISFEGNKIYSYSTVIGEIYHLEDGTPVYLLNTGSWSRSTIKHQYAAYGAIPVGAHKFSASCGQFLGHWSGLYGFSEADQMRLVCKYLKKQLCWFEDFKTTASLCPETASLYWWNEAKKFVECMKCTTLSKLEKLCNADYQKYDVDDPKKMRTMVRLLRSNDRTRIKLSQMLDAICGDGTYDRYTERTKGIRNARYIRELKFKLGFSSQIYGDYWHPYLSTKRPPAFGIHAIKGTAEGKFNMETVTKHRKAGDYVAFLLKTKQENFRINMENAERKAHNDRRQYAIRRLERHCGLTGFSMYGSEWRQKDEAGNKIFSHNGVTVQIQYWHDPKFISNAEYDEYCALSPEEQAAWRNSKKQWMLEYFQLKTREYEEWEIRRGEERRLEEIARQERVKLLAEKADYIKKLEAKGDEGIRQLWHENLKDRIPYNCGASFFHGGNVLLRVVNGVVETSKGIRISAAECKRLWTVIRLWHNHQKEFVENSESVSAFNATWEIKAFQNDILISGCHAIAYCEIESVMKQLESIN
ncbi:MAG: hypothetical protein LBM08_00730 [Dysgonamonadaceae bacterium]|jgi:hypothetical protein|nr:hypothetical protein [Dysgonamonadaceae bacterium]